MRVHKLFQRMRFGIFALFGLIVLSTSLLCIRTVDTELSAEYAANSQSIAKTIADASVDILLNRNLATLQSLIDQFVEVQGIRYIYITDEQGEFLAHTFVPGIPEQILESDPFRTEPVERSLPGMGDFIEVGSPILAGVAGTVHLGMDLDLVAAQDPAGDRATDLSDLHPSGARYPGVHLAGEPRRAPPGRAPRLCGGNRQAPPGTKSPRDCQRGIAGA